jgi:hypothetical protein
MSDSNRVEEHMLMGIHDDFETLDLDDGSKWSVEPGDNPTICTWIPTATIRVELVAPGSVWPYKLTNIGEDISVKAMKI